MGKYLVTSGSYFEPFTYEQLNAPIREMAEAHRTTQDAYDQISLEAEALRQYISDAHGDERAKAMYDSYMDKLSALQNNLWSNGYNTQTRRDLSAARAGYASDISRIQSAVQARQQRSAEYWKMKHEHPDMITGDDPGLSGLDNYLDNDLYGQDYFAYSGNQFADEIGKDIQARAAALLGDERMTSNPELKGWLTRVRKQGLTNDEANAGLAVVRALVGDDPNNIYKYDAETAFDGMNLNAPTLLAAQVLLSHMQSTGAAGKVSPAEFNKLFTYGSQGLSRGVMAPDMKDFEDKEYTHQLDYEYWKKKQDYASELEYEDWLKKQMVTAQLKAKTDKEAAGQRVEDLDIYQTTGGNAKKANRKTQDYSNDPTTLLIASDGSEVTNAVDASLLVYSEKLRMDARRYLGFDIGMDPTPHGATTTKKSYLRGTITDKDGTTFEVQYNPYKRYNGEKGVIEVRTGRGSFGIDPELTAYYKNVRKQYDDTLAKYKNAERGTSDYEIYKLADIDPKKQKKDYKKQGVDGDVPLEDFRETVMDQPRNAKKNRADIYIANKPTDSGKYVEKISDMISTNFYEGKNRFPFRMRHSEYPLIDRGSAVDPLRREHKGTSEFIHEVGKDGMLSRRVSNPDRIFDLDENYNITNLESVLVSPDSILNNCIIVKVQGSQSRYSVNIDMLHSAEIAGIFKRAQQTLAEMRNDGRFTTEDELELAAFVSQEMKNALGYDLNTQSQGGTSQENRNR